MPRFLFSALAGAVIGAVAWRGCFWLIALGVAMPVLVFSQTSRLRAAAVALAYYSAASWPVIVTVTSFSPLSGRLLSVGLWIAASLLLSVPWMLAWASHCSGILWRVPVALACSVVPPLGLIGWASPLVAAGILFPGTAWLGLVVIILLPTAVLVHPNPVMAATALASIATNLAFIRPVAPHDWTAINTSVAAERRRPDPRIEYANTRRLQEDALAVRARVAVFPETVIPRWTDATSVFWRSTSTRLAARGTTVLIGAGMPMPGSDQYRNAFVPLGETSFQPFLQRIPVPLGMWKPFGPKDGVRLNLVGPGTLQVGEHRVAPLICYEQLLVWPMLHSAVERPTLLVGIANEYWTKQTSVPAVQLACLRAWSRLFGIPLLTAVNS